MGLSNGGCLTILRLFHDYSSRNAATIADLYWLSGESPKRDAAVAVNGSAPPAAPLPLDCPAGWRAPGWPSAKSQAAGLTLYRWRRCTPQKVHRVCTADSVSALASNPQTVGADRRRAGMVCAMLHRRAWIHDTGAQLHPYIPYYNKGRPCPVQCPVLRRYLVSVQVLRLRVCPPAWRSWRIGGLFGGCIVCAGMGQINGNTAAKPCKRFWRCGRIIALTAERPL